MNCSMASWGAVSGTGSSIDSILLCASRRPDMRFDIERFGVGRLSSSSVCAPSDVRELFRMRFGEVVGRSLRLVALEVRLIVGLAFGGGWIEGDTAEWDGRLGVIVFSLGVGGAEEIGVLAALVDGLFETFFLAPCAVCA